MNTLYNKVNATHVSMNNTLKNNVEYSKMFEQKPARYTFFAVRLKRPQNAKMNV